MQRDLNITNKLKKTHLHLLHLIVFKKQFMSVSITKKDEIINYFFKKILKNNNAFIFYLCYETNNFKAHKFYKRNKFRIFKKNRKIIFVKKRY